MFSFCKQIYCQSTTCLGIQLFEVSQKASRLWTQVVKDNVKIPLRFHSVLIDTNRLLSTAFKINN